MYWLYINQEVDGPVKMFHVTLTSLQDKNIHVFSYISIKYCPTVNYLGVYKNTMGFRVTDEKGCVHGLRHPLPNMYLENKVKNIYDMIRYELLEYMDEYLKYPSSSYSEYVEYVVKLVASKYSVIVSPYFVERFIYYYVIMLENISFFRFNCSCDDDYHCKCANIVQKFH